MNQEYDLLLEGQKVDFWVSNPKTKRINFRDVNASALCVDRFDFRLIQLNAGDVWLACRARNCEPRQGSQEILPTRAKSAMTKASMESFLLMPIKDFL